ncbi:MAG: DUF2066 domain-containing protein [Gammaproteobacteria bacterium]|nr:DUF2066 domain-containing protein [Gammaproteobacteria bacterium]
MNRILICLILLNLCYLQPVSAVTVEDLYTVEVPVADQTTTLRLEAFREAFRQLIVKVSGSDDALRSSAFKRPVQNSSRYVKQFTYIARENEGEQELGSVLYLKIDFDQRLVESLLRDNHFAVWGRERPGSLMVISYDVNEKLNLVSGETTPELVDMLDDLAGKHGLPLLYPLMDLEDISLLRVNDVVSRHIDKIELMASRYAPDTLVVGQIVGRSDTGWLGDWEVRFDDQLFKWQYTASSQEVIVGQLVKHLSRVLALEYALQSHAASKQSLLMKISGLEGIGQLVSAQRYLQTLTVIDSVRISLIERDIVTFDVNLKNEIEDLQRLIEFGEVLEQEEYPQLDAQQGDAVRLSYTFIGSENFN